MCWSCNFLPHLQARQDSCPLLWQPFFTFCSLLWFGKGSDFKPIHFNFSDSDRKYLIRSKNFLLHGSYQKYSRIKPRSYSVIFQYDVNCISYWWIFTSWKLILTRTESFLSQEKKTTLIHYECTMWILYDTHRPYQRSWNTSRV